MPPAAASQLPAYPPGVLRILHLEDEPRDARLILAALEGEGIDASVVNVDTRAGFEAALELGDYDLIFSDYSLPNFNGLEALELARRRRPEIPFLLISGTLGEEAAIESLRSGATDYILKHRLSNLGPAVRRALQESHERRTRLAAERALQATFAQLASSERRIAKLFHSCPAAMGLGSLHERRLVEANDRLAQLMGYRREEMIGRTVEELGLFVDAHILDVLVRRLQAKGAVPEFACRLRRKSGEVFDALMSLQVLDVEGQPQVMVMPLDITERKRTERHRAIQYAVTRVLAESASLTEAARALAEAMGDGLGWDACALWLGDRAAGRIRCVGLWLRPSLEASRLRHLTEQLSLGPGEGLPGRVWTSGEACWVAELADAEDLPRAGAAVAAGLHGACSFPIRSGGRVNGAFEFLRREPVGPDESVISLMNDLGQQIGQFFSRRQAEEALLERSRLAALSAKVSVVLTREGTLAGMLKHCAEAVVRDLDACWVGIWTAGTDGRTLELQAGAGSTAGPEAPSLALAGTPGIIASIAESRSPYWSNDVLHDPRMAGDEWALREEIGSFVGHPLLVEGRLLGVFAVCAKEPLSDTTLEAFGAVADALALGIERKHTAEARRRLEAQYLQAQKMEAIGRLAGGIAHDFNNLLTAILGFGNLALAGLADGDPLQAKLKQIVRAGERAGGLTRQLLAFSRKQQLEPRVLDLNCVVRDFEKLLRRTIGEDIELTTELAADLGSTLADPGQIEQVLMNLSVNSRDAMPDGGRITVETANVEIESEASVGGTPLAPGRFVKIAVTDTGIGMDQETRNHVFEPFFTTKEAGKGTGLGLATVYGIVQQSGGQITIESEPGRGTRVSIYLLRVEQEAMVTGIRPGDGPEPEGRETILLVEDEQGVRQLVRTVLEARGYRVLEAASSAEALDRAGRTPGPLHLVISDIVMPQMNGPAMVRRLIASHPGVRVLFMTGYTDDAVLRHELPQADQAVLFKPFTPGDLVRRVREVLDADTPAGETVRRGPDLNRAA